MKSPKMKFLFCAILIALSAIVQSQGDPPGKNIISTLIIIFLSNQFLIISAQCLLPRYSSDQEAICQARLTRYSYNPEIKNCEKWYYGGCGGTDNVFVSMEDCVKTCKVSSVRKVI